MSENQLLAGGVNPNTLSHTTDQGPTRKQTVEVWRSSNVKIESQSVLLKVVTHAFTKMHH